jgi:hypothetical protein
MLTMLRKLKERRGFGITTLGCFLECFWSQICRKSSLEPAINLQKQQAIVAGNC